METVLIEFIFLKSIHQVRKRVLHTISVLWYSADFDGLPGSRVQNSILRSFFVDVTAPTGLGICNNVEHVVSCIRPLDPDCPRYTIFLRLRITNDKIDCRLYVSASELLQLRAPLRLVGLKVERPRSGDDEDLEEDHDSLVFDLLERRNLDNEKISSPGRTEKTLAQTSLCLSTLPSLSSTVNL